MRAQYSAELAAVHELVLDTANHHTAHRVDEREGAVVSAILSVPPDPPAVAGIGHLSVHMVGPEADTAEQLVKLCQSLKTRISGEADRLSDLLVRWVRSQADLPSLYQAAAGAHRSEEVVSAPVDSDAPEV